MVGAIIEADSCEVCAGTEEVYVNLVGIGEERFVDWAFCKMCRGLWWHERNETFIQRVKLLMKAKYERGERSICDQPKTPSRVPDYILTDVPLFLTLKGCGNVLIEKIQAQLYDEWLRKRTNLDGTNGVTMHRMLVDAIQLDKGEDPLPWAPDIRGVNNMVTSMNINQFRQALRR